MRCTELADLMHGLGAHQALNRVEGEDGCRCATGGRPGPRLLVGLLAFARRRR